MFFAVLSEWCHWASFLAVLHLLYDILYDSPFINSL